MAHPTDLVHVKANHLALQTCSTCKAGRSHQLDGSANASVALQTCSADSATCRAEHAGQLASTTKTCKHVCKLTSKYVAARCTMQPLGACPCVLFAQALEEEIKSRQQCCSSATASWAHFRLQQMTNQQTQQTLTDAQLFWGTRAGALSSLRSLCHLRARHQAHLTGAAMSSCTQARAPRLVR